MKNTVTQLLIAFYRKLCSLSWTAFFPSFTCCFNTCIIVTWYELNRILKQTECLQERTLTTTEQVHDSNEITNQQDVATSKNH